MPTFTPCTSLPANLSPWWIMSAYGGNSPCIEGNPPAEPHATISNCVGWAWGRYCQAKGSVESRLPIGNAGSWFRQAQINGLSTGSEPALGAVICFGGGHVAVVEEIAADGSFINCSESDWNGAAFSYRTRYRSQNWELAVHDFQGFIYNDEFTPEPGPDPEPDPDPPTPEPGNRFKWWMSRRKLKRRNNK